MRSHLLATLSEFGSSRHAVRIGYARMLPAIRQVSSDVCRRLLDGRGEIHMDALCMCVPSCQLERRGLYKDKAGLLQVGFTCIRLCIAVRNRIGTTKTLTACRCLPDHADALGRHPAGGREAYGPGF